jgi:nitroimidazol reductase NimA-like FMN-containing flavoprotein (pyridoxamine 5'-phosphate oxidase superfamily)
MQGTFTAKLATVKKDGSPHVVPIWFVLDNQKDGTSERAVGDVVFTTFDSSLKIRNIQRDNRVSICVDDQTPQFSLITIFGRAKIYHLKQNELSSGLLKLQDGIWERIMQKYMVKEIVPKMPFSYA